MNRRKCVVVRSKAVPSLRYIASMHRHSLVTRSEFKVKRLEDGWLFSNMNLLNRGIRVVIDVDLPEETESVTVKWDSLSVMSIYIDEKETA